MKVFVFDLDGVIRHWNPEIVAEAERAHGLPAGALLGTAFEPDLLLAAVTGKISDSAWRNEIASRLQHEYPEADGAGAVAQWSDSNGEVIESALEAVSEARKCGEVCVLTNATSRLQDDLAALGIAHYFGNIFNSSEIGLAKPDERVFTRVETILGVLPESIVYVDDGAANIEAAAARGWTSLLAGPDTSLADLLSPYLS